MDTTVRSPELAASPRLVEGIGEVNLRAHVGFGDFAVLAMVQTKIGLDEISELSGSLRKTIDIVEAGSVRSMIRSLPAVF